MVLGFWGSGGGEGYFFEFAVACCCGGGVGFRRGRGVLCVVLFSGCGGFVGVGVGGVGGEVRWNGPSVLFVVPFSQAGFYVGGPERLASWALAVYPYCGEGGTHISLSPDSASCPVCGTNLPSLLLLPLSAWPCGECASPSSFTTTTSFGSASLLRYSPTLLRLLRMSFRLGAPSSSCCAGSGASLLSTNTLSVRSLTSSTRTRFVWGVVLRRLKRGVGSWLSGSEAGMVSVVGVVGVVGV